MILRFMKKNIVFCVAFFAAAITCFFIPPDATYLSYFDFKTLACLFLTLLVVCALRNINYFTIVARKLVLFAGDLRGLFIMLISITFIGSMIIANDMALITFLPLGFFALSAVKKEKYMAFLFILQNIAANLGGMLTPFGNPQNLYLYSYFNIPTGEFTLIMLPPFLLAITLLFLACLFVKREKLIIKDQYTKKLNVKKSVIYCILFLFTIAIVFRVISFIAGLIIVPIIIWFMDKKAFLMVDYALLGTFFFFFIFSGNLSRVPAVNNLFSALLQNDTLLSSVVSCQVISNVPSAILLSKFTANYKALLLGVNIGGTGTLIASLASLITFSEYRILYRDKTKSYFLLFTLINFIFLILMTLFVKIFII